MVKHTQTFHRQKANKLFECVWPLLGMKQMLKNFQKKILENLNRK